MDGGGSKGIMESIMLGHIMNLATIMTYAPEEILSSFDDSLKTVVHGFEASSVNLKNPIIFDKISNHEKLDHDPIHPTAAFQYIVGKF